MSYRVRSPLYEHEETKTSFLYFSFFFFFLFHFLIIRLDPIKKKKKGFTVRFSTSVVITRTIPRCYFMFCIDNIQQRIEVWELSGRILSMSISVRRVQKSFGKQREL